MAKSLAKTMLTEFPWIDSAELDRRRGTTKAARMSLRKSLPAPLYWSRLPGGKKIFWNWELTRDYLVRGNVADPAHQKLVEQYLSTLPKA